MPSIKHVLLIGCALLSTPVLADEPPFYGVPVFEQSKSLARYDDELPAVMTYYVKSAATDVITRYQTELGSPLKMEKVGSRLSLYYQLEHEVVITISAQDHWTQVDIVVRQ